MFDSASRAGLSLKYYQFEEITKQKRQRWISGYLRFPQKGLQCVILADDTLQFDHAYSLTTDVTLQDEPVK